jgi:putative DNA primase/helicase
MSLRLELATEEVWSMLLSIPAHDRDDWWRIGMALKAHLGDAGWPLFDDWSQTADNYNVSDTRSVWRSFRGSGVGIGSLVHMAKQNGYNRQAPTRPAPPPRRAPKPQQSSTARYARYAAELWLAADCSDTAITTHAYGQTKRLLSAGGAGRGIATGPTIGKNADCIIVPIRENGTGKVQAVECINAQGDKCGFGPRSEGYLLLGNTLDKSQIWYVLEGWSSAYALVFRHLKGNCCAAISFGKSNQQKVAEMIASTHKPERVRILKEVD